ncbi:hypothetical protein EV694_0295 [Volucribacter psittacicida]|uniref:Uncharacterized protein n=1 Tax=Volucribacter psittacicida TaxID=203482 RepID=A0A4R1G5G1_9PAST|nr:hypothetical protein [Volucribacter psittacicida]TCK01675.1 hypothetical protein EV694_0295 [Volucribacter psittacicida]
MTTQTKPLTRKGKVITALLSHPNGISGREIDMNYFINSGRNEVAELESKHNIALIKTQSTTQSELGQYTIYRLASREEAIKAITLLNRERVKRDLGLMTEQEQQAYLANFKA